MPDLTSSFLIESRSKEQKKDYFSFSLDGTAILYALHPPATVKDTPLAIRGKSRNNQNINRVPGVASGNKL